MAVSYRKALFDLLGIIERRGGYRDPIEQDTIARARTLAAVPLHPITVVVCNIQLCPSRLELAGDLTPEAAASEAERMQWWTDGARHVCPAHEGDQ